MEHRYRIRYRSICDIPDVGFPVNSAYVVVLDKNEHATAEGPMLAALAKFRTLMLETPNEYDHEIISIQSVPTIAFTPDIAKSPNVRLILTMYHSDHGTGDSMMETIKYAIEDGLDLSDAEIQYLLESVGDDDFIGPEDIHEYLADRNHVEIVVEDGAVSNILTTDANMDATIIYVDHDDDDDASMAVNGHLDMLANTKGYHRIVGAITMTPEDLLTKDPEDLRVWYNKDLNTIDMTPSAAIAINRLVIDAANVVSDKPEDVHMLLDIIHTLTDNTKWLPDEGMLVRMDIDTLDMLVQKVGGILIDTADDDQRFIMLANTLTEGHRHGSSARENVKVSIRPGDVVKLGGLEWVVQHIDGNRVYLALRTITDVCAGDNTDSMLKTFTKKMRPLISCNFRAFVPSREQLETEWDWPKAGASNRICQLNGSNERYWTSTADGSGISYVNWYVNDNGVFCTTFFPSHSSGFRPAIEIGIDDLTRLFNQNEHTVTNDNSVKPGDDVVYGEQHWIVQHVENDRAVLALRDIVDLCTSDKIDDMLNEYRTRLAEKVGHPVDMFVPTREMYELKWDWPKASASNRICQMNGSNMAYWTSTATYSSGVWGVGYYGYFDSYGYPSNARGFRPAIEVTVDELTSESNESPFNLGDVVIYGDQRWIIQHIDDDMVYMATTDITDQCTLHRINDKLNDWKVNLEHAVGHDVDVFIPSKAMYEDDWDWPSASAENRICKNLSGCNSAYWTRTTESSGCGWFVSYEGTLRYNIPSCTFGLRPAIGVTMDELIKKGVLDGNEEG